MDTEYIRDIIQESIDVKLALIQTQLETIKRVGDVWATALQAGHPIYLFGNGGSAADAQHIAGELVGTFESRKRTALPAVAFSTNTSTMTALANDFEYDYVFTRHVEAFVKPGDVAVGLSTSGNSRNVLLALDKARTLGAITVGLTGKSGGQMPAACDHILRVPSVRTPRIQEAHILIGHVLCGYVEEKLFAEAHEPQPPLPKPQ